MTERKLIWFLQEYVLKRSLRPSRYRKSRTNADDEDIAQTLGKSAVSQYVCAVVDLWSFQKSGGSNSHPNPRGEALKGVIRTHQRGEHARKRSQYVDRGAGSIQDGYGEKEMLDIVRQCWVGWEKQKKTGQIQFTVESYLRTAVDFLLGHNMLLRGEARRMAELPDLFTIELNNEGPTRCHPMILIMDNGKTNQVGRLEYGTVIRHRNPFLCTMGHTAAYLFYRWNMLRECPPQFQQRQLWYDHHLLRGNRKDVPLSYDTLLEWTNKIFSGAGHSSLKKTHAGRAQGAKYAELNGVGEAQIRRAGRWNNDTLTSCYLTHIPREFVRSMAGFNPSGGGVYYLPRARVEPPESLLQAVWPWVDQWLEWYDSPEDRPFPSYEAYTTDPQPVPSSEDDRMDLAGQGFLRLLVVLRIVFLQDSVILRREFPQHPLWKHEIFAREDYKRFAQDVEDSLNDIEEPEEVRLRTAVPIIAERLNVVRQDIAQRVDHWGAKSDRKIDELSGKVNDFFSGRVSFTLNAQTNPPSSSSPPRLPSVPPASSLPPTSSFPPTSTPPPTSSLTLNSSLPADTSHALSSQGSRHEAHPMLPGSPPSYELSRTIRTVNDLWREWTVGLGSGPAVQTLEDSYGPLWRPSQRERVMYGRRKIIINEIRRRQSNGMPIAAAVEQVELVRQRGDVSLHRLSQMLKGST